ncbi:MAG: hypothetical protein RLZZ253_2498 [Verrucomicrobiota bacterium]
MKTHTNGTMKRMVVKAQYLYPTNNQNMTSIY